MKRLCLFSSTLVVLVFNGCFFANIFDFGPEIDLGKNQWKISSFVLGGVSYYPGEYEEIPSMRFDIKELKLYGNTGCNAFFASYTWINDKKIEMRNSGLTRKICQSEEAMKFEQKLMEEFDGDFEVTEREEELILRKENLQITLLPLEPTELKQEKSIQAQESKTK